MRKVTPKEVQVIQYLPDKDPEIKTELLPVKWSELKKHGVKRFQKNGKGSSKFSIVRGLEATQLSLFSESGAESPINNPAPDGA